MELLLNQKEAHRKGCAVEQKNLIQGIQAYYLEKKSVGSENGVICLFLKIKFV